MNAAIPASDREKMMEGGIPEIGATLTPEQVRKPPRGVMPDHIWRERRISELAEAIARHAGSDFDLEQVALWIREAWTHMHWLEERENKNK